MQEEFELQELEGDEELSLLETLDHVLDKGLVVSGDITISVANIDLIYLNLNALLGSVETVNRTLARRGRRGPDEDPPPRSPEGVEGSAVSPVKSLETGKDVDTESAAKVLLSEHSPASPKPAEPAVEKAHAEESVERLRRVTDRLPERINVEEGSVEQGLGRLVLTLIELIRRLLEKQAVRRMEGGGLDDSQVEDLGLALMKLEEKMRELKVQFGIDEDEDLNLDLGPIGRLI